MAPLNFAKIFVAQSLNHHDAGSDVFQCTNAEIKRYLAAVARHAWADL